METTLVSIRECLDKEDAVYAHNGIPLGHNQEGSLAIQDDMDGPWRYYAG